MWLNRPQASPKSSLFSRKKKEFLTLLTIGLSLSLGAAHAADKKTPLLMTDGVFFWHDAGHDPSRQSVPDRFLRRSRFQ
jgi:hypothetical protein